VGFKSSRLESAVGADFRNALDFYIISRSSLGSSAYFRLKYSRAQTTSSIFGANTLLLCHAFSSNRSHINVEFCGFDDIVARRTFALQISGTVTSVAKRVRRRTTCHWFVASSCRPAISFFQPYFDVLPTLLSITAGSATIDLNYYSPVSFDPNRRLQRGHHWRGEARLQTCQACRPQAIEANSNV